MRAMILMILLLRLWLRLMVVEEEAGVGLAVHASASGCEAGLGWRRCTGVGRRTKRTQRLQLRHTPPDVINRRALHTATGTSG